MDAPDPDDVKKFLDNWGSTKNAMKGQGGNAPTDASTKSEPLQAVEKAILMNPSEEITELVNPQPVGPVYLRKKSLDNESKLSYVDQASLGLQRFNQTFLDRCPPLPHVS